MKAVILAGGLGTRLSEETTHKPKPMVEVGGRPILWHVMKIYSQQNYNDFHIALGFKAEVIKELSKKLDSIEQKADEVYEKAKKKKKDKR